MLEGLITAAYLADPAVSKAQSLARLNRYYRSVRRAQVQLRFALDPFPILKSAFLADDAQAIQESEEYYRNEATFDADDRLKHGHWSGNPEGLKGVAKAIGLSSDYAIQYKVFSGSLHAGRPWDHALFDPQRLIIVPDLQGQTSMAAPLAFDAFRYLAWLLRIAFDSGAIGLYRTEQAEVEKYRQYMQSMNDLHINKIVDPFAKDAV